ncbi:MAG: hypothetical protein BWY21_01432 [Parcubacteria group bacterium ADurb.Bin216]|nr:MAG: hypothetical protein BWY21_01432 [Parcubacteria group bacterium ADurb.Bin216]
MIEVRNGNIYRSINKVPKRIGYILNHRIYDDSNKELCFVSDDTQSIYDHAGKKIIQVKGNTVFNAQTGRALDIDDSVQSITAVGFSNIYHIAISIFFAE